MKRILTVLLTIGLTAAVNPEVSAKKDPCRKVQRTTDPFTKQVVKVVSLTTGPSESGWVINAGQQGDKYYVGMVIRVLGINRTVLKQGDKIIILLENEKTIELEMTKDYEPAFTAGPATYWTVSNEVDLKTIKRLARSPIVAVKAVFSEIGDMFLPTSFIKPNETKLIMESIACMLDLLPEPATSEK